MKRRLTKRTFLEDVIEKPGQVYSIYQRQMTDILFVSAFGDKA